MTRDNAFVAWLSNHFTGYTHMKILCFILLTDTNIFLFFSIVTQKEVGREQFHSSFFFTWKHLLASRTKSIHIICFVNYTLFSPSWHSRDLKEKVSYDQVLEKKKKLSSLGAKSSCVILFGSMIKDKPVSWDKLTILEGNMLDIVDWTLSFLNLAQEMIVMHTPCHE